MKHWEKITHVATVVTALSWPAACLRVSPRQLDRPGWPWSWSRFVPGCSRFRLRCLSSDSCSCIAQIEPVSGGAWSALLCSLHPRFWF